MIDKKFYKTAAVAAAAAKRRGEFGVTGSGQECFPACFGHDQWAFRTWDGRFIIPGGELSPEEVSRYISEVGAPARYSRLQS